MCRPARSEVFDPTEVSIFHCINRCVRRCFLCGRDPLTGKDFNHRKRWLEARFRKLAGRFAIDVLGFAILDNHFHLILRNRPDVADTWDDREIARRWLLICPKRKTLRGDPETPSQAEIDSIVNDAALVAKLRIRLCHISWFMAMVAGPLARDANKEEGVTGRFWEGRFKSVKLCSAAAVLACLMYVDLNLIRARMASSPETSNFTSAQRRIQALTGQQAADGESTSSPDDWLAPLPLNEATAPPGPAPSRCAARCSDRGCLPITTPDYLNLLDWTGRRISGKEGGVIPAELAPILTRLGIVEEYWLELAGNFGRLFHRVAGSSASVALERARAGRRFRPGQAHLLDAA